METTIRKVLHEILTGPFSMEFKMAHLENFISQKDDLREQINSAVKIMAKVNDIAVKAVGDYNSNNGHIINSEEVVDALIDCTKLIQNWVHEHSMLMDKFEKNIDKLRDMLKEECGEFEPKELPDSDCTGKTIYFVKDNK